MKTCVLLFINLLLTCTLAAQTSTQSLTKEQMYADFDEFYHIITNVNPQLTLRKKVTGVDIAKQIYQQRARIDTLSNSSVFFEIVAKGVRMCNDAHATYPSREKDVFRYLNNDTLKAVKLIALQNQYSKAWETQFMAQITQLPLFLNYYKGNYYSVRKFHVHTGNLVDSIALGAKIIAINKQPIDSLINSSLTPLGELRWDNVANKLYWNENDALLPVITENNTISIQYEFKNEIRNLKIKKGSQRNTSGSPSLLNRARKGSVRYFPDYEILYIRLPVMEDSENYYVKEIAKYADSKLKKVVIDIRQNPGGADYVWMNILRAILKDTLDITATIGLKNTDVAVKAFGIPRDSLDAEVVRIPALDNEEFLAFRWGKPLIPLSGSLGYTGKIYILQDRDIFSSAGSLSNVAWLHDNIVSVGECTGKLLGFGLAPLTFTLPHSYFTFKLEPVLDIDNAETAWDYYHDKVEIPVDIPISERLKLLNRPDIYSENYLFNHDPVFRKMLEQAN